MLREVEFTYTPKEVCKMLGEDIRVEFTTPFFQGKELEGALWDETLKVFQEDAYSKLSEEDQALVKGPEGLDVTIKLTGGSMFRCVEGVPVVVSFTIENNLYKNR